VGLGQPHGTKAGRRVEGAVAGSILATRRRRLRAQNVPADQSWRVLALQRTFAWEDLED
jgi:hypothetical protein